jgi:5-methylcytosine-specific restriction endonuclease McrA
MNRGDYLKSITKEDPEKYCAFCGQRMHRARFDSGRLEDMSAFMRRKYCSRECMRKGFIKIGHTNQEYRPAHASAYHIAYQILGREKRCEICGSSRNIDVHHIDHDYRNNTIDNIMILCRRCHIKIHNRYGKNL